jgi:hypothetical protein
MRCDLEQMEAAARAVVRTSAVAPRDDAQLRAAERREVLRPIDDVVWERRDLLFHRREPTCAGRVGPLVDLGLSRERSRIRLRRRRLLCRREDTTQRCDERDC